MSEKKSDAGRASYNPDIPNRKDEDFHDATAPMASHHSQIESQHNNDASSTDDSVDRVIKEEGIEIHDWDGPNDPENPYV